MKQIKSLYLEITKECNLECRYCYNHINKSAIIKREKRLELLKAFLIRFNEIIIDELRVCLHGGEALLQDNLPMLKDMTKLILEIRPHTYFIIQTNGILLREKDVQEFLATLPNKGVIISFDSTTKHPNNLPQECKDYINNNRSFCHGTYLIDGREDYENIPLINEVQSLFDNKVQLSYNFFKSEDLDKNYIDLSNRLKAIGYKPYKNDKLLDLNPQLCGEITLTYDGQFRDCNHKTHGISKEDLEYSYAYLNTLDCENCKFKNYCIRCGNRMANFRNNLCYFTKAISGELE